MKKLEIGCGAKKREGYDGLDIQDFGQKYVMNILSLSDDGSFDNKFDEVYAEHFLEHFYPDDIKEIFKIVHKILNDDGIFKIIVPSKDKDRAWVLTHKTFWTEYTFKAFENEIFAGEFCPKNRFMIKELKTNNRKDIYCELIKI